MASLISIGGVQVAAPDQGDTFLWGAAIKTALAQIAATCLQTTGGSFPLTADLNLGSSFGLVLPYIKSANGTPASTGLLRFARTDSFGWLNNAGSANDLLQLGDGATLGPLDELVWNKAGVLTQITGRAYAEANTTAGQSIPNTTNTIVNFGTVVTDTDGAVTTGAGWKFTVPLKKPGIYYINGTVNLGGLTVDTGVLQTAVFKNGASVKTGDVICVGKNGTQVALAFSAMVNCAGGDTLAINVNQSNGGARTLTVNAVDNRITIQGPF